MKAFCFIIIQIIFSVSGQRYLESNSCPEQHGEQTYAHPESCEHYVLCVNGTFSIEQCENGLLYDGVGNVHNHCNYNWAVTCGERKADVVAISSPGCEYRYGIYAGSSACSSNYIKCAEGQPYETPCEPGLAYDDRIKKCNWPDQLLDQCNPEAVVGFKCPEKIEEDSLNAKFWPYPRYAIPNDCERLVTCVDGFPRLITCGDGKVFNEETLACAEPEEVPRCAGYAKERL